MQFEEISSHTKYQRVEQKIASQVEIEDDEHCGTNGNKKLEWTTRRKLLLFAICLINAVVFGTMSVIMPYFPTVGVQMGLSKTVIGFIFSSAALTGVFTSPLTGMLLRRLNPKLFISGGLVLAAVTQIMFGFGKLLPPGTPFVVWCFLTRILSDFGAIISYTVILAILPQEFTTNYATVLGISEIFSGLGIAGAPALGGLIYQVSKLIDLVDCGAGGYIWPNVTFGLLMLVTALLLVVLLWDSDFEDPDSEDTGLLKRTCELLKIPGVLIGAECIFLGSFSFAVLEPIYALFGNQILHLNASQIGLVYTPLWLSYLVACGLTGKLVDKVGKHLLIMIVGYMTSALGYLLIGPAPSLGIFLPVGTIWLTIVSELFIGVGQGLVFVPPLPYMMQSVRDEGLQTDITTTSLLSIIFTSAASLGVFVGPVIADFVAVRMEFAELMDCLFLRVFNSSYRHDKYLKYVFETIKDNWVYHCSSGWTPYTICVTKLLYQVVIGIKSLDSFSTEVFLHVGS